jgi:hypothetical protein
MTESSNSTLSDARARAKLAVRNIVDDISDRRGLKRDWNSIDADIRESIEASWTDIIELCFTSNGDELGAKLTKLRAQLAGSVPAVPVSELRRLLDVYEGAADGPTDYVSAERRGEVAAYALIAGNLRALVEDAEQRAAAKPAEESP